MPIVQHQMEPQAIPPSGAVRLVPGLTPGNGAGKTNGFTQVNAHIAIPAAMNHNLG